MLNCVECKEIIKMVFIKKKLFSLIEANNIIMYNPYSLCNKLWISFIWWHPHLSISLHSRPYCHGPSNILFSWLNSFASWKRLIEAKSAFFHFFFKIRWREIERNASYSVKKKKRIAWFGTFSESWSGRFILNQKKQFIQEKRKNKNVI